MKDSKQPKITNPAILVIDLQNDFCSKDGIVSSSGYDVSNIQKMVVRIEKFLEHMRKTGIPVVFVKSCYDEMYLPRNIAEVYRKLGLKNICKRGAWGSDFYKVKPKYREKTFVKHRYDAFTNPELEKWLKKKNIKTLILTGAQTDVCIDSTARSGFIKGFNIVIIKDCTATSNSANHKKTLDFMEKYYNALVRSSRKPLQRCRNVQH